MLLSVFKLQANETLQNSTLSRTATDLLQAKRQIFTLQQQLQDYQKKEEDVQAQISFLQEKIRMLEMVRSQLMCSNFLISHFSLSFMHMNYTIL